MCIKSYESKWIDVILLPRFRRIKIVTRSTTKCFQSEKWYAGECYGKTVTDEEHLRCDCYEPTEDSRPFIFAYHD